MIRWLVWARAIWAVALVTVAWQSGRTTFPVLEILRDTVRGWR